jgi:glycosyltransferase involved in cell wall biosynthesis
VSASRRILVMNERDLRHPQAGGAEVHCFEIFRRLAAAGDHVTLLASGFPRGAREEDVDGIHVVRLGNRFTYYALVARAYRRLRRAVRFDVVVEDMNKFPFFARFWVEEPLVVFAHHLFGTTAFRQVAFPIAAATYVAERLVPFLYRGVPIVAVSPSTREELVRGGAFAADVRVIPNAVDHARYRPGTAPRMAEPTVLVLGRIEPYKRTELIVEAIARLPGVRLVVAGSGTGIDAVAARVAALGIADRVTLAGFVDEDEKVRLLQTAHVVATASEKEGWGLTVLEAGACGTPAVATDVPGLRDAVRDGETGLLVRSPEPLAIADALRRMFADAKLRARLGEGARRYAATFDWDAVAGEISAVLDAARGGAGMPAGAAAETA